MCANFAQFCVFSLSIILAVSSEATNKTVSGYSEEKEIWAVYLEFAAEAIGKAKNSSVILHENTRKCEKKEALISYLEAADEMLSKAKINYLTIDSCYISSQPIQDCSNLLHMGHNRSGVYTISPRTTLIGNKAFDVYCDMETDGGGWTVIQRRGDFQNPVDYFFKDWKSYKEGFGDLEKEFWLGNDKIFALTNQEIYSARFYLVDNEDNNTYAHYDEFWIDGENSKYTLHISNYSGDAGNSMENSNNQKFSTKDQDNDTGKNKNCAQMFKGAWWFSECFEAHLNGENLNGKVGENKGKIWVAWRGKTESLSRTEIKIRPKNFKP